MLKLFIQKVMEQLAEAEVQLVEIQVQQAIQILQILLQMS